VLIATGLCNFSIFTSLLEKGVDFCWEFDLEFVEEVLVAVFGNEEVFDIVEVDFVDGDTDLGLPLVFSCFLYL
jgi:hypothetical protein